MLRDRLLAWYDANARDLPWRVGPADHALGERADPYRVWLSEVMLQQTTVPHATPYFLKFTHRWPSVGDLAAEGAGAEARDIDDGGGREGGNGDDGALGRNFGDDLRGARRVAGGRGRRLCGGGECGERAHSGGE